MSPLILICSPFSAVGRASSRGVLDRMVGRANTHRRLVVVRSCRGQGPPLGAARLPSSGRARARFDAAYRSGCVRRSVHDGHFRHRLVELRAAGAFAVERNGKSYRLAAVEADPTHIAWLERHTQDNKVLADRIRLIHGPATSTSPVPFVSATRRA